MPTFREDPKIGTKVPLIKTADLNDKSVTEKKLADGSITKDKIAIGAVTSEKLQHNAVTTETINDGAVTAEKIAEGAVSVDEIKDLSVEESKINNKAVTNVKIDDAAVDTRTIEDKSVTNAKIADESITQEKIFNSSVTTEKLADESVSAEKLQSGLRSTIVSTHDKAIELDKKKANVTDVDYALECLENKIGDRVVVEGNVTNLPDDEDLTSVSTIDGREVMRLNDRAYEPNNFSGKGYKILRKNIQRLDLPTVTIIVSYTPSYSGDITITINGKATTVALDVATDTTTAIIATKIGTALKTSLDDYDVSVSSSTIVLTRNNSKYASPSSIDVGNTTAGITVKDSITKSERKNILTQDMINDPNTVYEIRYDFDLNGEEITIRKECVLKFDGGSFRNGTVNFDNTFLAENTKILCKFSGNITNDSLNLSYFVDSTIKEYDCSDAFQSLVNMRKSIYIPDGTYYIKKRIILPQNFNCYGNGRTSKIKFTKEDDVLFYYNTVKGVNKPITVNIHNICFIGTYPNYFSSVKTKDITNTSIFLKVDINTYTYYLNIINCEISSFKIGCDINQAYFCHIDHCLFTSLYDALVLRETNASSYTSNDFKYLFHTGITFLGSGDGRFKECTGNTITGNDFSDLGFAGIWILAEFMNSLLAGNYFEKRKREDSENPNSEIVVGDINNEYNLTYTPTLSSCIVHNSGLWAPRGIVLANCEINNNLLRANLMIKKNVRGKNNSGYTETVEAAAFFSNCLIYDTPYRFGAPEQTFYNVQTIDIQNFAIKANSLVNVGYVYAKYISFISFKSSSPSLRLVVKRVNKEEYYTPNGSEGESEFILPYLTTPFKYTGGQDTEILIKNTSENNIGASIEIKYLKHEK